MLNNHRIVVVMPAFNAARTLPPTVHSLPQDIVDDIVVVDDGSVDDTASVAESLGIPHVIRLDRNRGYGANQKVCYDTALELGADIVVMVHPDYQYDPRLVLPMSAMLASGVYDCVLGSRILGLGAIAGGMPRYKYIANRTLTAFQNLLLPHKLSEYHTGLRAWSARLLRGLPYERLSDDFVFDNHILIQTIAAGFSIGEVSCPTRYAADSSSIGFQRSLIYGLGVVAGTFEYKLSPWLQSHRFPRYLRNMNKDQLTTESN